MTTPKEEAMPSREEATRAHWFVGNPATLADVLRAAALNYDNAGLPSRIHHHAYEGAATMTAERAWATTPEDICRASLMMMDDHWGAISQSCDLIAGHDGDHAAQLRACIPVAVLSWPQNTIHQEPQP